MADVQIKARAKAGETAGGTASSWFAKIDARLAAEDDWRKKATKVVRRYRDEAQRGGMSSRVNILWSNTEVLKAALYVRTAKPDIRARFPDAKAGNTATRLAAEAMERGVIYVNDVEDVDDPLGSAIDDMLLPGRGTVWVSYEPEIEEPEEDDSTTGDADSVDNSRSVGISNRTENGNAGRATPLGSAVGSGDDAQSVSASGTITDQYLCLEYVYWEDYLHGLARTWKRVPWVARRHVWTEDEVETKFPDAEKDKLDSSYKLTDASGKQSSEMDDGFVEGWELWSRAGKKRIWLARGYKDILQEDDDPYKLTGFFPCPKPLWGVKTTDRMIPQPEFLQYQDQANELDIVSTRLRKLTQMLKWKSIHDGAIPDGGSGEDVFKLLAAADDGESVPHMQYAALRDRGGIEAAFAFVPIEKLIPIIENLRIQKAAIIQTIYEITGISDIVRGSTDPNETKGAQVLKAQFGSMRIQKRQREVQRFIRDAYRLEAEIVAEHFTLEKLQAITGLDLPTKQEQDGLKAKIAMVQQAPPGMGHNGGPPMDGAPPQGGMMPAGPGPTPASGATGAQQGMGGPAAMMPPPGASPVPMAPPGIEIPDELVSRANGPNWDDVMTILRSDKVRQYRVDVETDDTEMQDAQAEKANRNEFSQVFEKLVQAAYQAAIAAPQMLPLIKEWMLFSVRTYKVGRGFEQVVEDMFDKLAKEPPPNPTPPPDQGAQPQGPDPVLMAKVKVDAMKLNAQSGKDAAMLAVEQHKQGREDAVAAHSANMEAQRVGIEKARLVAEVQQGHDQTAVKLADMKGKHEAMAKRPVSVGAPRA